MLIYYCAIFLPLVSFFIVGLGSSHYTHKQASIISCMLMTIATACSYYIAYKVLVLKNTISIHLLDWLSIDSLTVNWGLYFDPLSCVMLIVIMTISTLVHFYSIEYMAHDNGYGRFMAYLGLFTFMMLMLVTADNMLQLFFGWEGVGLASYLLIGFWYYKDSANAAAMKAFIMNRIGDLGLVLAIGGIFYLFGGIKFVDIFSQLNSKYTVFFSVGSYDFSALETIGILLFIGAMGKSAQIGLHTWLPDAMEGPTPVSALIHAATMVTAGVFLIARLSPLYEHTIYAKNFIVIIGAATAVFAGTIAITQNDIKRVIAYSTCSQLGYMFLAAGLGYYNLAVFHLFTHAFFKALLFLGAGSVIHALSGEQDMRKMGGIYHLIPYTYAAMWIGTLALTGFPFLAGYYSKDAILDAAINSYGWIGTYAYTMGIIGAILTALYSGRLMIMTFHGASRLDDKVRNYIHESRFFIMLAVSLLSVGALCAGYIGSKFVNEIDFWQQSLILINTVYHKAPTLFIEELPTLICILSLGFMTLIYTQYNQIKNKIVMKYDIVYQFFYNKWYIDELYNKIFVSPLINLGQNLWLIVDHRIIDRFGPNGLADLTILMSRNLSRLQSGYMYHYAFVFIVGFFIIMMWLSIR